MKRRRTLADELLLAERWETRRRQAIAIVWLLAFVMFVVGVGVVAYYMARGLPPDDEASIETTPPSHVTRPGVDMRAAGAVMTLSDVPVCRGADRGAFGAAARFHIQAS